MKTNSADTGRWLQILLLTAIAALAAPFAAHARTVTDDLSPDQISQLKNGGMVVISQDVPGGSWPKLKVYTLVNAPVQAVKHVFTDYAHASSYIPDLVSADVIARPSADVLDVKYTTTMPVIGQTSYTVRNVFSRPGNAVVVKWTLIESPLASQSEGSLHVEPYGSGSIMRYTNYVQPKLSALAGFARGAALSSVKNTVAAIKTEAEKTSTSAR